MWLIEDDIGNEIIDKQGILNRWTKYVEELYETRNRPDDLAIEDEEAVSKYEKGFSILSEEVELHPFHEELQALGFSKENTEKFNYLLEDVYEKDEFTPGRIYNVDENCITVVQSKVAKIIGLKDAEYIEEANKKRDFSFYESVLKKQTTGNQSFPENREECDVDEPQVIAEFDSNQPSTSSAAQFVEAKITKEAKKVEQQARKRAQGRNSNRGQ
ncbi:hypothetical protein ANN_03597 [Periplaneta americana]|uniref:Uncharacterized protein n=1 Tax=Periplaneta americana TaxID=6978 RepID=A0ABQ8TZA7_PERAM|nr:hypothetical protein ANN_03597 [Periplaneta americana]